MRCTMINDTISAISTAKGKGGGSAPRKLSASERERMIETLTKEMKAAASKLEFEQAAFLRDRIRQLREGKDI